MDVHEKWYFIDLSFLEMMVANLAGVCHVYSLLHVVGLRHRSLQAEVWLTA